jgi:magnesium transporter
VTRAVVDDARELVALVQEGRWSAVLHRAGTVAAADLADVLQSLRGGDRTEFITRLPPQLAARALAELPRDGGAGALLATLGDDCAARIVAHLEDDDAADLLVRVGAAHRERILALLHHAADVGRLLGYDAASAGGLMTARVVTVVDSDRVALAVESVRRQAASIGDLTEIFVVDAQRRLRGILSIKALLLAEPVTTVRDHMVTDLVHLAPDAGQDQVVRMLTRYNLTSVPVVDGTGRLLGRVTADDVREVTADQVATDLLRAGGLSAREGENPSWLAAVRGRLPWLYLNLLPSFVAAAVVYFFADSLLRAITLVVWMPVVAGAGGSAGTQALAVAARRRILNTAPASRWTLLTREALVGLVNGLAIGVVVAGVAVLLGESWKLGLVVLLAMTGNLCAATVAGALLPGALRRWGRDRWEASPALVSALADAVGFALLLGLASLVLL